jgi:uncharacterized membrane protein YeiB
MTPAPASRVAASRPAAAPVAESERIEIVDIVRGVAPRRLALGVPLVAVVGFVASTLFYQGIREKHLAWREAVTAQAAGRALTPAQDSAPVA